VQPETRYARSGEASIAYQVLGDGPIDLLYAPGAASNVEYSWQIPAIAGWWRRLAQFSRLIVFDKRGTGLSDRDHGMPTLEERIDDMRAVLDAARSERVVVYGDSEGATMSILFAATYPERTIGLVLFGGEARWAWAPDHPWGMRPERLATLRDDLARDWGTLEGARRDLASFAPSAPRDPELERAWASWIRFSCSPADYYAYVVMNMDNDVRHVLPAISVPTLVAHRTGDRVVSVEQGRYVAARIPGARWVELPGEDHYAWFGDSEALAREIERFVADLAADAEIDRVLATVLFTDIVDSTGKAAELGDRAWRELVERHHTLVRGHLARFRGREIDTAGDGFFASFDGPARAIRCACAVSDAVRELELEIRAGLHTGEVELGPDRPRGITVHIGARVAALAAPGEVLVSSTVKDLVAGSGLEFEERGTVELRGVPGEWRLFAVRR
jgi:class 3 adenylate cyclase